MSRVDSINSDANAVTGASAATRQGLPLTSLLLLAWRNLWRNRKRTGIMLAAIALGVWAMIFMSALMRGMVEDMLGRGIDQLPGHVQIHHPLYLDDPSVVNSIPEPSGEIMAVLASRLVQRWFSRVKVPAVVASERETRGVLLHRVDPETEQKPLLSNAKITQGRFLHTANDKGIVMGEKLASRLETDLGKRIVVMSQDPDNQLAEKGLRIVGLYKAEFPSLEEVNVYMGKNTVQSLLNIKGQVSEVAVFGDGYRDVSILQQGITTALATMVQSNAGEAAPWHEIDGYLGSTLGLMDGFVLVWIVVVFLALSFGLANTLVMAVFERVREIGLIMALGMRPRQVLWQIMLESCLLLLIGLALGNLLALLSVYAISDGLDISAMAAGLEMAGMGTVLYPLLLPHDVLMANVVVIVLGFITSFLPAWRASRYDPIRALTKST